MRTRASKKALEAADVTAPSDHRFKLAPTVQFLGQILAILLWSLNAGTIRTHGQTESQTLTWTSPATNGVLYPGKPVPLVATASSGLPVAFRVESGPAKIVDGSLVATNWGRVWVTADQPGDATFLPVGEGRILNRAGVRGTPVGEWPGNIRGEVLKLTVSGDRAYAAFRNGLAVFDISDPARIVRLGGLELEGWISGLAVEGSLLCVVGEQLGLRVIDISDAAAPWERGAFWTPGSATAVAIKDGLAFVADGDAGLQVISLGRPELPVRIGGFGGINWTAGVAVDGNRVFVVGHEFNCLDVSNPAHPRLLGGLPFTQLLQSVAIAGDLAVVSGIQSPIQSVDIADPRHPRIVGGNNAVGTDALAIIGHEAWCAVYPGNDRITLKALDLRDPLRLPVLRESVGTKPNAIAQAGVHALVGSGDGLVLFDTAGSTSISSAGSFRTGFSASDVEVVGSMAYLADGANGLQVLDVSDPAAPKLRWSMESEDSSQVVKLDGTNVYLADRAGGLVILDARNPASPVRLGSLKSDDAYSISADDVAPAGGVAFVAGGGLLHQVDVSDLNNPRRLSTYLIGRGPNGVETKDGLPLTYDSDVSADQGVVTVDFSDPLHPVRTGRFGPLSAIWGLSVWGDRALMTSFREMHLLGLDGGSWGWTFAHQYRSQVSGAVLLTSAHAFVGLPRPNGTPSVGIFDYSRLGFEEVGSIELKGRARNLRIAGDLAYVAEEERGLGIYRLASGIANDIRFDLPSSLTVTDPPFRRSVPLEAVSASGKPVAYHILGGPAFLEGTNLVVTNSGPVRVRAEVEGEPPLLANHSDKTLLATKLTQELAGYVPTTVRLGSPPLFLNLSASSGLPVTVTLASGPAILQGQFLQFTGAGLVTLYFAQQGNEGYWPVYSKVAVRVTDPVVIRRPPQPVNGVAGDRAELSTFATGEMPIAYRWFKDGAAVANGTNSTLRFPQLVTNHAGLFHVVVSNPAGAVTSSIVSLTVGRPGSELVLKRRGSIAMTRSPGASGPARIEVADEFAFVTSGASTALRIYDIAAPDRPLLATTVPFNGTGHEDSALAGKILYLAERSRGLGILDVKNPRIPRRLPSLLLPQVGSDVVTVRVDGHLAYVGNGVNGLYLLDITNPEKPSLLGSFNTPGIAAGVFVKDSLAYVADWLNGFQVVDIANSSQPTLLARYPATGFYDGRAYDLFARGAALYVADFSKGFRTFDLGQLESIRQTSQFSGSGFGLEVHERWAFVADSGTLTGSQPTGGVRVFDLSNPLVPSGMGRFPEWGFIEGMVIRDGRLLVAGTSFGILDIVKGGLPPALGIETTVAGTRLAWPNEGGDLVLESADSLAPESNWEELSGIETDQEGNRSVTVPPGGASRFFRLRKP